MVWCLVTVVCRAKVGVKDELKGKEVSEAGLTTSLAEQRLIDGVEEVAVTSGVPTDSTSLAEERLMKGVEEVVGTSGPPTDS